MSGKVNKVRLGRFLEIKDNRGITQLIATDDVSLESSLT